MMLFWKIRYVDRSERDLKDRCLWLDTDSLDPIMRATVELCVENESAKTGRKILKYRHLFVEMPEGTAPDNIDDCDKLQGIGLDEYIEDETGKEVTLRELGPILTGNPNAILLPSGTRQYDLEFMQSEPKPFPIASVSLNSDEVRILGYFTRDLQELMNSAFMKDSPGTLTQTKTGWDLKTAATDDEIRSFVTIFRRLFMTNEPANFQKAIAVFTKALGDHPHARWVAGVANEYKEVRLKHTPHFLSTSSASGESFTTKLLIEVFLYTQYAHQPDKKRQTEFFECLNQVDGKLSVLTWLFLGELRSCSSAFIAAGKIIAWWFKKYCDHHKISPDVLRSLRDDHSGLGKLEKEQDRQKRLFRQQVEKLAADLWEENGRPEGGPNQFLAIASERLAKMTDSELGSS